MKTTWKKNLPRPSLLHMRSLFHQWHYRHLMDLVNRTEASRMADWENFTNEFKHATENMSEYDKDDYAEYVYDDMAKERDLLPRLSSYSLFLLIYSFIENELKGISDALYSDRRIRKKRPKQKKGDSYISCYFSHIRSSSKLRKRTIDKNFRIIEALRPLRNCIAHDAGDHSELSPLDRSLLSSPPFNVTFPILSEAEIPFSTVRLLLSSGEELSGDVYKQLVPGQGY